MKTQNPTKRVKRPAPISLRLTNEERAELEKEANTDGTNVSTVIRARLFRSENEISLTETFNKAAQHHCKPMRLSKRERQAMLAKILGLLGQSNIAASLRELADAAQIGILPVSADVETELRAGVKHISEVRSLLLQGLGFQDENV